MKKNLTLKDEVLQGFRLAERRAIPRFPALGRVRFARFRDALGQMIAHLVPFLPALLTDDRRGGFQGEQLTGPWPDTAKGTAAFRGEGAAAILSRFERHSGEIPIQRFVPTVLPQRFFFCNADIISNSGKLSRGYRDKVWRITVSAGGRRLEPE